MNMQIMGIAWPSDFLKTSEFLTSAKTIKFQNGDRSTSIYTAVSFPSKSISTNRSYYGTIITNKFEILPLKSARVSIHEVWVETHSHTHSLTHSLTHKPTTITLHLRARVNQSVAEGLLIVKKKQNCSTRGEKVWLHKHLSKSGSATESNSAECSFSKSCQYRNFTYLWGFLFLYCVFQTVLV